MGNSNVRLVKNAVNEFMSGNSQGYIDYLDDDFYGKIWSGLIPGGDEIKGKEGFVNFMEEMNKKIETKKFEPTNWAGVGETVYFTVNWEFVWRETNTLIKTSANVRKVVRNGKIVEKYHLVNYNDVMRDISRVNKDLLLTANVQKFDDWYEVFSQHATKTSLSLNERVYNPKQARNEFMDESRTEVWRDVENPNLVLISCYEVEVPKMVYFCKEDPEMIRMTSDFGWEMDKPTEMRNMDPRSIDVQEDMLCCLEVENSEKWIQGFKEHGTSKKISGFSEDLLMSRSELCDESRTRIFKHAWKPNWVAVLMYDIDTDKLGQLMEDEKMLKMTKLLGEKEGTKMIKISKSLDI